MFNKKNVKFSCILHEFCVLFLHEIGGGGGGTGLSKVGQKILNFRQNF